MSEQYLIVPIDVAALAVSPLDVKNGACGLGAMVDFSQLPGPGDTGAWTSDAALAGAAPFAKTAEQPLLAGIHLHWSLPRQLTRGNAGSNGLTFLGVPDRWLVTRIFVPKVACDNVPPLRSWVVESDRLTRGRRDDRQPSILIRNPGQIPKEAWLGDVFPAENWREQDDRSNRAPRPFTALGYGDPSFAAFYPNCRSVFGLHDALDDLKDFAGDFTLSYQVSGWYAMPGEDPLQQIPAQTLFGWNGDPDQAPKSLVCNGLVDGIEWDPARRYLQQADQPLDMALANTTREALSALLAGGDDTTQLSLNSLQFGLLAAAEKHDTSIRDFEQDVHEAGFVSLPGGATWSIGKADQKDHEGDPPSVTAAQAQALASLNQRQARHDERLRGCLARQAQLFQDWHQFQQRVHSGPAQADPLFAWLKRESNDILKLRTRLASQQVRLRRQAHALQASLPVTLQLQNTAAPRFYQPAEPVLMLAGEDVRPPARHAPDTLEHDPGHYRLSSQRVKSVTLDGLGANGTALTLDASELPQPGLHPSLRKVSVLPDLISEALFICKGSQQLLARLLARKHGDPQAILDHLLQGQSLLTEDPAAPVHYVGQAPAAALRRSWRRTPWLPLLVQYEISLATVEPTENDQDYPEQFLRDHFRFSADSIDLTYPGKRVGPSRTCHGSALLVANATLAIKAEIERCLEAADKNSASLAHKLRGIDRLPLLTQNLSSLNDTLLMRRTVLQLPVDDPRANLNLRRLMTRIRRAIGNQGRFSPRPLDAFRPLRAEGMNLLRVRLVDVFGRFKDYPGTNVRVATGITPPDGLKDRHAAFLPPRITQPARLQFRWQAAREGSTDGSPVLGWIMPSHLDSALMIYAPNGKALGEVALHGEETRWFNAPTGDNAWKTKVEDTLADQPQDLVALVNYSLDAQSGTFFERFLAQIEDALRFCLPDRFAQTAEQVVLSGQPLVLARASLTLELAGPPARSQSALSLDDKVQGNSGRHDGGLGTLRFPVRLGALDQFDDTLVAYWIAPTVAKDYGAFLAPQGGAGGSDTLSLVANGEPLEILMLLDPRGSVHASSGVLPAKVLDLPPRYYVDTLAALDFTFECFPVLTGADPLAGMSMVLPGAASTQWRWTSHDGKEWSGITPQRTDITKARLDHSAQRITEGWLSMRRGGGDDSKN